MTSAPPFILLGTAFIRHQKTRLRYKRHREAGARLRLQQPLSPRSQRIPYSFHKDVQRLEVLTSQGPFQFWQQRLKAPGYVVVGVQTESKVLLLFFGCGSDTLLVLINECA